MNPNAYNVSVISLRLGKNVRPTLEKKYKKIPEPESIDVEQEQLNVEVNIPCL